MAYTISRFTLLLVMLGASVHILANSSVPVSDLENDVVTHPLASSQVGESKLDEPVAVEPVITEAKANANAQMFDLVEMLQQELQQLRGKVEELTYKFERLEQSQKERYLDLDRRIVSLSSQPKPVSETQGSALVTPTTQVSSSAVPVVQESVEQEPVDPEVEKAAYKAAFNLIRERQYDDSIVALLTFVEDFPEGALVGNAYYWLGEVYMVQGDASLAAKSFERVISDFPTHRKIPDALYKAGVAYQNIGDSKRANKSLQRVLLEYPDSSAARLAQERVN